jgi:hypothetical protein
MKKILYTIIAVIIITCILNYIPNKSNFPKIVIIPILTAGLIKYSLGDWDKGYTWSIYDLFYWLFILILSGIMTRMKIYVDH